MPVSPDLYTASPEPIIVALAATGDEGAFSELVRRRQSWLRNLLRRLTGDAALADDLGQQAFLQAWRRIDSVREHGKIGPWLRRIAVNAWLQQVRRQDPLREAVQEEPSAEARSRDTALAMDLDSALGYLSKEARLCVVLAYNEGMSHGEIADTTTMPLGTVKSHIRRGTQSLRQMLGEYRLQTTSEQS